MVAGDGERAKADGFERDPEGNANDIVFDAEGREPGLVEGRQQITRRRGGRP